MSSRLGKLSLSDLELFAEDEMIEIVSSVNMSKLRMISGEYGPFEPMERASVPLWLALVLKRNNKCRIVIPQWMSVENLQSTLERDKSISMTDDPTLCPLPDHYIEISRLMLENCEDDITDSNTVRSLLDRIIKVRENRLNEFQQVVINFLASGLEQRFNQKEFASFVKRPYYDVISGASSVEVSRLFSQFLPVLEELNKSEDTRKDRKSVV